MIFIDNIDIAGQMAIYLQYLFFARLSTKTTLLIQVFSSNLIVEL